MGIARTVFPRSAAAIDRLRAERDAALALLDKVEAGRRAWQAGAEQAAEQLGEELKAALARAEKAEAVAWEWESGERWYQMQAQLKDAEAVIGAVDRDDAEAVILAIRYRNKYQEATTAQLRDLERWNEREAKP